MYIRQRSIPVSIILSIVTCGIYAIYWFIILTNEINQITENQNDTSGGMCFLLTLITCNIYGIYWAYKMGAKLDEFNMKKGAPNSSFPILFLVLELFGLNIVNLAIMQNELNKYVPAA